MTSRNDFKEGFQGRISRKAGVQGGRKDSREGNISRREEFQDRKAFKRKEGFYERVLREGDVTFRPYL